jgi:hypothetical protein
MCEALALARLSRSWSQSTAARLGDWPVQLTIFAHSEPTTFRQVRGSDFANRPGRTSWTTRSAPHHYGTISAPARRVTSGRSKINVHTKTFEPPNGRQRLLGGGRGHVSMFSDSEHRGKMATSRTVGSVSYCLGQASMQADSWRKGIRRLGVDFKRPESNLNIVPAGGDRRGRAASAGPQWRATGGDRRGRLAAPSLACGPG